jgi:PAS domain S-box-containing protein
LIWVKSSVYTTVSESNPISVRSEFKNYIQTVQSMNPSMGHKCVAKSAKEESLEDRVKKKYDSLPLDAMSDNTAIRDKTVLLESILDAVPEFIVYYDDELNVIWANRAAAVESGISKEEMVGRNFFEAACRVKVPCEGCPVIKGLSSEYTEIIESNVYAGRLFYTRSYPIHFQDRRIPGRLFVAQDVSHLRNRYSVTEVLNLISEVFNSARGLSDICEELVKVIAKKFDYPAGFITLYDEHTKEIVNVGEVDFSGKLSSLVRSYPTSQCFSWKAIQDRKVFNVTGLSKIEDFTGSPLKEAGAETVLAVPLSIEDTITGAIILVDVRERLESSLMVDGLQAVANRLSAEIQRKQTEEKLREERNFTNAVLNNAGPLVMVLDREGRVVRFNKACERLTGYTYEEVSGKSILDFLIDSKESDLIRKIFPLAPEGIPPPSFEGYWNGQDGQKHLVSWSNSLMGAVEESGVHIVSIGIDITDKRRAEEEADLRRQQLLEADKMASLGVLASGVAHEINNPNNFIMMNTPILKTAWKDISPILEKYYKECGDFTLANMPYSEMRSEVPRLFDGIESGSERITKIVMNMKNYARNDVPDKPQQVDMNDVVTAAVWLLSYEINKSTRSITVETLEGIPLVMGNLQRLEQVAVNLIQNACQSLPDRSKAISIRTQQDRQTNEVIVSVVDEGVGIKPEHMNHILEPFFTTKSDRGGTGLGLSVCATIVKEHGGRLEFKSESGKGTEVRLALPAIGKEKHR